MNLEEFLASRTELPASKIIVLRYLEKVADVFGIDPQPKGRSKVECRFDCGAYKGEEIITFRMDDLNPIFVAAKLMHLTSGHNFSFPDGENSIVSQMGKRVRSQADDAVKNRQYSGSMPTFTDFCKEHEARES